MPSIPSILLCLIGLTASWASPAADTRSPLDLLGGVTAVSDYRFRGISQSRTHPAAQAELELSHRSGAYAGIWGSTIDLYDDDAASDFDGSRDVEIDYSLGWRGDIAPGMAIDTSVVWYSYPGVTGHSDYAEMLASLTIALGPVAARVGGGYFPDQRATAGDGRWLFGEASAEIEGTEITAHLGRQSFGKGFGAGADYWEWSFGATHGIGPVELGLSYVDTDLPRGQHAGAALVASAGISF